MRGPCTHRVARLEHPGGVELRGEFEHLALGVLTAFEAAFAALIDGLDDQQHEGHDEVRNGEAEKRRAVRPAVGRTGRTAPDQTFFLLRSGTTVIRIGWISLGGRALAACCSLLGFFFSLVAR
jgi:hypothetical protein